MGYNSTFIDDQSIDLPSLAAGHELSQTGVLLEYQHFSIYFSEQRKMPIFSAVNINGKTAHSPIRGNDIWLYDKRILENVQIGHDFYKKTQAKFHRGHIVRRLDPCWGLPEQSNLAEKDTFHFTNACPQHQRFNPAIWLELERNILEKGCITHKEPISVFCGPVLRTHDRALNIPEVDSTVKIPLEFWKVVVWKKLDGKKYAVGFLQSQKSLVENLLLPIGTSRKMRSSEDYYERIKFKNDQVYQVTIHDLEHLTGLRFKFEKVECPFKSPQPQQLTLAIETSKKIRSTGEHGSKSKLNISNMVL